MSGVNHKSGKDHTVIDINDKNCIFRVPNVLRRQNPEAYTPDVVSIGPFHRYRVKRGKEEGKGGKDDKEGKGEEDFQLIKQVKRRYLNEFLTGIKNITLEELTTEVIKLSDQKNEGEFEQRARDFYAESLHISTKKFIKMMIVDGCFLIQLFRKCDDEKLRAFDDPVFNMDCMFHFLCHDILLLENQLPWFVIHSLYSLISKEYPNQASLSFLVLEVFSTLPSLKHSCSNYQTHLRTKERHCDADFLHILDLVRASMVNPLTIIDVRANEAARKHERGNKAVHEDPDKNQIRTATALSKADIKFKNVETDSNHSIMDIQFKAGGWFNNGILEIPQLNVGMSSKTLFRNLIAIEQCYHGYSNAITSYAIFMDNLISSNEDMELLRMEKVIGNWMSDEDGCKFFSDLYKDIAHKKFYYVDLCEQLNYRYRLKRYTWLASLKSEKFSNPCRILAFAMGIFILILTAWSQINNIRVNMHK